MKSNKRSLKALALSLGLAALMAPATMDAQNGGGIFGRETASGNAPYSGRGMMKDANGININIASDDTGITNQGIGEPDASLGSGLFILLGAGLGYVALKKKEDEQ